MTLAKRECDIFTSSAMQMAARQEELSTMKFLSAFVLAASLGLGIAGPAQAAPTDAFLAESELTVLDGEGVGHTFHQCHGASAGTADRACGSWTGGPSGSLH